MRNSDLRRLNQRFVEAFGRPDAVNAKYKWVRTTDLPYFIKVENRSEAGLYLMTPKYERHTWAEILGDTWVVAQWKAPEMPRDRWLIRYGTSIPYPANGRYMPIENTALPPGVTPDATVPALVDPVTERYEQMPVTDYAIGRIRAELEKSYAEFLSDGKAQVERVAEQKKQEFGDMVDSDWPAFDGIPGEKHHVSFPTVQLTSR
jgi:hypothetical protein